MHIAAQLAIGTTAVAGVVAYGAWMYNMRFSDPESAVGTHFDQDGTQTRVQIGERVGNRAGYSPFVDGYTNNDENEAVRAARLLPGTEVVVDYGMLGSSKRFLYSITDDAAQRLTSGRTSYAAEHELGRYHSVAGIVQGDTFIDLGMDEARLAGESHAVYVSKPR